MKILFWFETCKRTTLLPDGRVARFRYDRVSLLWVFMMARNLRWDIVGEDRSGDEPSTAEDLRARYGVEFVGPSLWETWSLLGLLAIVLVISVVIAL